MNRRPRSLSLLAVCAVVLLTGARSAGAHETPDETGEPFYAGPVTLTPEVGGFDLDPIGSLADFDLHVERPHTVVVLGYEGEPYLQVDGEGTVFENRSSPTYYLNSDPTGGATVPATASATVVPSWTFQSEGGGVEWHDHRLHWMSTTAPEVGPDGVVSSWQVDLVVDGRPVTATGQLLRHPDVPFERYKALVGGPPSDGGGVPLVPAAVALVAVVAVLAAAARASTRSLSRWDRVPTS